MPRYFVITLLMFVLSVYAFVWSVVHFAQSETALHAGCLIVSGSVWLCDLVFTCAFAWDAGRHLFEVHRHPRMYVVPPEQTEAHTLLFSSTPEPAQPVRRAHRDDWIPMSERPDPITRLDIQRPVKDWKPPVS